MAESRELAGRSPGERAVEIRMEAEEELHLARARATSRRNLSLFWTGVASMYLTWGVMGEGAAAWILFVALAMVAAYSWKGFAARRREEDEAAGRLRGLDPPDSTPDDGKP